MLRAARWGAYEPGAVTFRVHDRLDVFTYEGRADCAVSLRVYPELERLRHLVRPFLTQPFAGSQIARSKGEGIEFADIRPFQYGDQVRRVNWRASARRGEMLLTESNPERTADVVLLLDGYADVRSVEGGTLDSLVRAAASLAQGHLAQRDRVGVITFGAEVTWLVPGLGDRQLYQIVESLIETAVARSLPLDERRSAAAAHAAAPGAADRAHSAHRPAHGPRPLRSACPGLRHGRRRGLAGGPPATGGGRAGRARATALAALARGGALRSRAPGVPVATFAAAPWNCWRRSRR